MTIFIKTYILVKVRQGKGREKRKGREKGKGRERGREALMGNPHGSVLFFLEDRMGSVKLNLGEAAGVREI